MNNFNAAVYDAIRRSSVIRGSAIDLDEAVDLLKNEFPDAAQESVVTAIRSMSNKLELVDQGGTGSAVVVKVFAEIDPMYRRVKPSQAKVIADGVALSGDVPVDALVESMRQAQEKPKRLRF